MDGGAPCIFRDCTCSTAASADPNGAESEDNVVFVFASGSRLDWPVLKISSDRMVPYLCSKPESIYGFDEAGCWGRVKCTWHSSSFDARPEIFGEVISSSRGTRFAVSIP